MALGPMAVVMLWKKTTAIGVPFLMCVPLEKVGPKPLAATSAQTKSVRPKMGMTIVFAMKR